MITLSVTCDARPFDTGQCQQRLEYVTTDVDAVYGAVGDRGWVLVGTRHLCPGHATR